MKKITPEEQIKILDMIKEITGGKAVFVAVAENFYHGELPKMIEQLMIMEGINPNKESLGAFLNLALKSLETAAPIEPGASSDGKEPMIVSPYLDL